MSNQFCGRFVHNPGMTTSNEELIFNDAFCGRVKRLREEKAWSAEQMAIALGIPPDRYRKYEGRSPMPQYLIPRFAGVVGRSVEYILTGREEKRLPAEGRLLKKRA